MARGPLAGVRVLEWARYLPGPYCGQLLADLGARVTKVEEPGSGDPTRLVPPERDGSGAIFHALNRGKRSLALDLKKREGVEVFRRLAAKSTVLIDGHRPGVAEKLGLGHRALRRRNPRLVYCALTGFGQRGPYAKRPGHDLNYQALAGIVALTGRERPIIPGVQVGDILGAWSAAVHILAALRTRRGAFLDVSMTDAALSAMGLHLARVAAGEDLGRPYELSGGAPYYNVYECADGKWLALGCLEPRFWQDLCRAVPELADLEHKQYAQGAERDAVETTLRRTFRSRARDEWVARLVAKDVPAGPVHDVRAALADPQVKARKLAAKSAGLPVMSSPFAFDGRTARARGDAPRLGQHTDAVLRELGYAAKDVRRLREAGAVT